MKTILDMLKESYQGLSEGVRWDKDETESEIAWKIESEIRKIFDGIILIDIGPLEDKDKTTFYVYARFNFDAGEYPKFYKKCNDGKAPSTEFFWGVLMSSETFRKLIEKNRDGVFVKIVGLKEWEKLFPPKEKDDDDEEYEPTPRRRSRYTTVRYR